jgi:hypothetical protein
MKTKIRAISPTTGIVTILLTFVLIFVMGVTMLMSVDFDVQQINWFDFSYSLFNWVAGRVVYFPAGNEMGNADDSVQLMVNTINRYRNIIYKKKINKEFREKIDKHNRIAKCNAYMDYVDEKLNSAKPRIVEKYTDIKLDLQELISHLEKNTLKDYKGKINIDSINIKYDKLEFSNIFAYGNATNTRIKKYEFSPQSEGLRRSWFQFLFTAVISFFNAAVVVQQYGFTLLTLYMFAFKVVMFGLGCYNGIQLGYQVIVENKYAVMLNLADRAKEILTEIEKDHNIILDDGQEQVKQPA